MGSVKRSTCGKGHVYDQVRKNGQQQCSLCNRERVKAWRKRKQFERKNKS